MGTPKIGGEIIDINGRISIQAATAQEIADVLSSGGTPTADEIARVIEYDLKSRNREANSGLAVRLIADNKICLIGDGDEDVFGRLEGVERDQMCTVTMGAQVMHFQAYGIVLVGAALTGSRSANDTGDFGYVKAASGTQLRRGIVLAGKTGSDTVGKIRCIFRSG